MPCVTRAERGSDRTGTTTYRYDATNALKGIDKPNGSGVEYGYDLMGRMKTLSEWTGVGKPRYTTTYDYDGFGNLKSVLRGLQENNLPIKLEKW
jgi:uncharacterized protein RhaS with RHS repeats